MSCCVVELLPAFGHLATLPIHHHSSLISHPLFPPFSCSVSPSNLLHVRQELEEMELDDDHRARIEDFLFKKSLFLEVRGGRTCCASS